MVLPLRLKGHDIPSVSNIRFLGIIFDSRLTWGIHIRQLRTKCQSDLRLLSLVSRNNWGCDPVVLRSLYISLIRSKLDYCSFLFGVASKSQLLMLDRVQFSACRIILGAYRPTPTCKLEMEADLIPLDLRRKTLMAQYGCRVLTVTSHPFASLLRGSDAVFQLLRQNYVLSLRTHSLRVF